MLLIAWLIGADKNSFVKKDTSQSTQIYNCKVIGVDNYKAPPLSSGQVTCTSKEVTRDRFDCQWVDGKPQGT